MFRRLGLVTLAVLLFAGVIHAQSRTTIIGSVVNAQLAPIAGVRVSLTRNTVTTATTLTDAAGRFTFNNVAAGDYVVHASLAGYPAFTKLLKVTSSSQSLRLPIVLMRPEDEAAPVADAAPTRPSGARMITAMPYPLPSPPAGPPPPPAQAQMPPAGIGGARGGGAGNPSAPGNSIVFERDAWMYPQPTGETYSQFEPNRFHRAADRPLSTFSADVDTASYANMRRFLASGQLPPAEAIRVEEFINYFRFGYAAPRDGRPMSLTTEIGDCPWAPSHKLVLIGARAAMPEAREVTARNIVLLVDVSGSMQPQERLPLIKTALALFVDTLRPDDTLAIVTYAGNSGVALPPTPARRRDVIQRAIANMNAGGSTNGASGLILAYRTAREAFVPGGVNRVILATDGDFNVGVTSQQELLRLIERERESGVFLSVFGVGSGNLKDATMEMLADKGNGNYSYLDSLQEARRVLIREGDATLEAVAKDVKFQVAFNPDAVASWKLIGYENRRLAARDFDNDRKDAGEMGAGHTVTALYEIVPTSATRSSEWLTVSARYKEPEGETSRLMSVSARPGIGARAQFLPLASAVAEFGQLLRDDRYNDEQWKSLTTWLRRLDAPPSLAVEFAELKELVATARGLAKIR